MTETIEDVIIRAVIHKQEFSLLQTYHKTLFQKDINMKYINYTLDRYNLRKDVGVKVATNKSLQETIELMNYDFQEMQEAKQKY